MLRESREHRRFARAADFLERISNDCPHELFRDSERASQTPLAKIKTTRLIVVEKENFATRMAGLVIPTVGDNRMRHEALQRFMLANDSTTLGIEVPIWPASKSIRELEREHGVALMPEGASYALTGHIDFLQVRNRAVHILDYKQDANRAAHGLRARAHQARSRPQALRYQMRVVQRGGVLRIFPASVLTSFYRPDS